ncbi:MAG: hypothetical protein CMJ81_18785 [Planctomycetaceae bacterium]|mgnify:CR=1 FL=1|nr:hypothetical protein [Planctomycetaceae bacterium]MBP61395.1 hypothetical protein [Planctomycetaceae bacterium]
MSTSTIQATSTNPLPLQRWQTTEDIHRQVRRLLDSRRALSKSENRRRSERHPFPYLIKLCPVGEDGTEPAGESVVVVGKQLSSTGFDFYHQDPIAFCKAIASLPSRNGHWLSFLVELTWCRFTELGWYDNGGRFLRVANFGGREHAGKDPANFRGNEWSAVGPFQRIPESTNSCRRAGN